LTYQPLGSLIDGLGSPATGDALLVSLKTNAIAFAIMLPVNFQPHGMFSISLPRYALFVVPIVFGWTIAPLAQRASSVLAVIGVIALTFYAIDNVRNDAFAPWAYVQFVREHPQTRQVPFDPFRAAEVADRRAGQHDRIAIDAAFGTWIHPAFGVELARHLGDAARGALERSELFEAERTARALAQQLTRTGRLLARIRVGQGPHGLSVWPEPGRYSLGHTGILR
jgi:hypothetical protein